MYTCILCTHELVQYMYMYAWTIGVQCTWSYTHNVLINILSQHSLSLP